MTRLQPTDRERKFIEPSLPVGEHGPIPGAAAAAVRGRDPGFKSGGQRRQMPAEFGAWSTETPCVTNVRQWSAAGHLASPAPSLSRGRLAAGGSTTARAASRGWRRCWRAGSGSLVWFPFESWMAPESMIRRPRVRLRPAVHSMLTVVTYKGETTRSGEISLDWCNGNDGPGQGCQRPGRATQLHRALDPRPSLGKKAGTGRTPRP